MDSFNPGGMRSFEQAEHVLNITFQNIQMRVVFLDDYLVRIRLSPEQRFAETMSWSVPRADNNFSPVTAKLIEHADRIEFSSSALTVRVFKADGRLEMENDGRQFFRDSAPPQWTADRSRVVKNREPQEKYYGFGERGSGLEKHGQTMRNWNTDPPEPHGVHVDPMYMSVPVYLVLDSGNCYGVYFNCTFDSRFDLSLPGSFTFDSASPEIDFYLAAAGQPLAVIESLSNLLGRMPLPPLWSLGYHQSRWSYGSQEEVLRIARTFRQRGIPCDAIHLDIDYMDGYRIFTWNKNRFPDPAAMTKDLEEQNFKVVTIIDPGIKVDPDYSVYCEGVQKNMFIRTREGDVFSGFVWPDLSVFPDFCRADVRAWWAEKQNSLADVGVSGIWNDMNEPTVFEKPFSEGGGRGGTLPLDAPQGSLQESGTHAELHNLYGSQMAQASYEGMRASRPGLRSFHLTRAGFAGVQRWSASWMGDNFSTWEHLEMSVRQLMNMGISCVPFVGVDIGGFFGNASAELYARWIQIGALYPFSRGHTCSGTNPHEPWAFGEQAEAIARKYLGLRYRLMPYLYSVFREASQCGYPVWRGLFLHYPEDEQTHLIDDQVLIGRDLMAAPILKRGQNARQVYLPSGTWFDWWDGTRFQGGRYILADAPPEKMPLYVRAGAVIPVAGEIESTWKSALPEITLQIFPDDNADFTLYEDDGSTTQFEKGVFATTNYRMVSDAEMVELKIAAREGSYEIPPRLARVVLRDGRQFQQKEFIDDGSTRVVRFERQAKSSYAPPST